MATPVIQNTSLRTAVKYSPAVFSLPTIDQLRVGAKETLLEVRYHKANCGFKNLLIVGIHLICKKT
jgi:hypothetical protein